MRKLVILTLILAIFLQSTAFALDMGGLLGGLTSMFSPDADDAYAPGETAEDDDVRITLTNVYTNRGNDYYTPTDGCEYVIVEFTFDNNSAEDQTLSTLLCFSAWCDNKMCSLSLEALGTALFSGKMQLDCIVESGESVTGVVGYEVPKDWEKMVVEYKKDSILSKSIKFAFENSF